MVSDGAVFENTWLLFLLNPSLRVRRHMHNNEPHLLMWTVPRSHMTAKWMAGFSFSMDAVHACLLHVKDPEPVKELKKRKEKEKTRCAWASVQRWLRCCRVKMCPRLEEEPLTLGSELLVCSSGVDPSSRLLSMSTSSCFWDLDCPETTSLLCFVTAQGSHSWFWSTRPKRH